MNYFLRADIEPFNLVNDDRCRISGRDTIIVFSAKGKSKLIMELIELVRERNAFIVCVTNDTQSPAALKSDLVIPIHAGEWKAPRTKVITLSALASLMLSMALFDKTIKDIENMINELVSASAKVIEESTKWKMCTKEIKPKDAFTFVGYGSNYPAVYYAKAKTKEILRWRSDIYQIEEFVHIETVAPMPEQYTVFLIHNCRMRHRVLEIMEAASKMQLLHYYTALLKDIDPDNPPTRTFARSVAFHS